MAIHLSNLSKRRAAASVAAAAAALRRRDRGCDCLSRTAT